MFGFVSLCVLGTVPLSCDSIADSVTCTSVLVDRVADADPHFILGMQIRIRIRGKV